MEERFKEIFDKYSFKFADLKVDPSTLYIVSTPVGNLEDISFRALFVLNNVDLVAAEDTRKTGHLLKSYGITKKIVSYYSQVERSKINLLIDELKSGKSIAQVSDAGTPGISDPGNLLFSACIEEGINMVSIPGANSMIHALIVSGFKSNRFFFQGFLPQKKGRQSVLQELKNIKMTLIIFESPYRIYKTLKEIMEIFGNKEISVSREMTKKFEQTIRGRVKDILKENKIKPKGEFVIVIKNI